MMKENENLEPVIKLLEQMYANFDNMKTPKKYYRNKGLKDFFGLSDNTIISYRDNNIIPFTKLGEIYYYPVDEIDKILQKNSNYDLLKN